MIFTPSEVRSYYAARLPHLKITSNREWRSPCPVHQGTRDSFAINSETGLAQCHSQCGRGWDMISFEQEISGLDFPRAKDRVFELVGRPKVPWEERNVEAIYDYTDAEGAVLYQVLRYHGKEFKQRRPDGNGGHAWGLGGCAPVPYRLQKLRNAEFVAVCEGEKDCLTMERLGVCATCNNGGAGNFRPELAPHFNGKHVAVFPDNDDKGREHALKVAALLAPVAKSLKIVELPDLPLKGDVTDFVLAGGTLAAIRELYRKAQPWTPEWQFGANLPSENDAWVRSISQEVEAAGGVTEFWNLARLVGLQTPWKKLSHALGGGMRTGEVYVLGANQGAGKTSMALQFTISAMRRKEGVLYFSMEMSWRSIFHRMASIEARVDLNELRRAQIELKVYGDMNGASRLNGELMTALARQTSELSEFPLLVCTRPSITPDYIIEETKRLKRREKINLVVVDHMQLMASSGDTRGDYEKFTAISRAMKQVSVEINVPVLLVSQTNRLQAKEHRGEVEASDLRGSGAIEEDAAAVLLLYESAEDRTAAKSEGDGSRYTKGPVKCVLKIGKNRYGEQGRCFEFQHYKSCTRFDMASESEA